MSRPLCLRIAAIRDELLARLQSGDFGPGDRFFSQRALARHFGISPQTAFRLLDELRRQGRLLRRPGSGSVVPGGVRKMTRVVLCFSARAKRKGSFGSILLDELTTALSQAGVPWSLRWREAPLKAKDVFSVLWPSASAVAVRFPERQFVLLLLDRPSPGIAASYIDSVTIDDFGGGVAAGEILRLHRQCASAVFLAGPADDPRSQRREAGFRTVYPDSVSVGAQSWFREAGESVFAKIQALEPKGVFCANDRLAEGFLRAAAKANWRPPPTVGFDNAPVARRLGLSTVAIPWKELAGSATGIVKERLNGSKAAASHIVINPRAIIR